MAVMAVIFVAMAHFVTIFERLFPVCLDSWLKVNMHHPYSSSAVCALVRFRRVPHGLPTSGRMICIYMGYMYYTIRKVGYKILAPTLRAS
jgi:hypothetical protein